MVGRDKNEQAIIKIGEIPLFHSQPKLQPKEFVYLSVALCETYNFPFCNDLLLVERKTKTERLLILYMPS